jgi:hypothetical protein
VVADVGVEDHGGARVHGAVEDGAHDDLDDHVDVVVGRGGGARAAEPPGYARARSTVMSCSLNCVPWTPVMI